MQRYEKSDEAKDNMLLQFKSDMSDANSEHK